jgi:hypothetical protein
MSHGTIEKGQQVPLINAGRNVSYKQLSLRRNVRLRFLLLFLATGPSVRRPRRTPASTRTISARISSIFFVRFTAFFRIVFAFAFEPISGSIKASGTITVTTTRPSATISVSGGASTISFHHTSIALEGKFRKTTVSCSVYCSNCMCVFSKRQSMPSVKP